MLTRRTATVTTSAPDASMAFWVSTKSWYLPVPSQSGERTSMPAIVSRSSCMRCVLPTADEPDDFHAVPVAQRCAREGLTVHHREVQLHGDSFGGNAQVGQERSDRVSVRHLTRLSIHGDAHGTRMIPYAAETVSTAQARVIAVGGDVSYNSAMVPPRNLAIADEFHLVAHHLQSQHPNPLSLRAYRQDARLHLRL